MSENSETNLELIAARFRAGENQLAINVELGLSGSENMSSGSGGSTSVSPTNVGITGITSGTTVPGPRRVDPDIVEP